jgi:hypothetical protein
LFQKANAGNLLARMVDRRRKPVLFALAFRTNLINLVRLLNDWLSLPLRPKDGAGFYLGRGAFPDFARLTAARDILARQFAGGPKAGMQPEDRS